MICRNNYSKLCWNWKSKRVQQKILENNTLLASGRMPIDLFIFKSSVQKNIHVFRVGEAIKKMK